MISVTTMKHETSRERHGKVCISRSLNTMNTKGQNSSITMQYKIASGRGASCKERKHILDVLFLSFIKY